MSTTELSASQALESAVLSGTLSKLGAKFKSWKKRLFVLTNDGKVYYFKDEKAAAPTGVIELEPSSVVGEGDAKPHALNLSVSGRTYVLVANDNEHRDTWIASINSALVGIREASSASNETSAADSDDEDSGLGNRAGSLLKNLPASDIKDPDLTGVLKKMGEGNKAWKKRYFVLKRHTLLYFKSASDKACAGYIPLGSKCEIGMDQETLQFHIFVPDRDRKYMLQAESNESMMEWVNAIGLAVASAKKLEEAKRASGFTATGPVDRELLEKSGVLRVWFGDSFKAFKCGKETTVAQLSEQIAKKMSMSKFANHFSLKEVIGKQENQLDDDQVPYDIMASWQKGSGNKFLFSLRTDAEDAESGAGEGSANQSSAAEAALEAIDASVFFQIEELLEEPLDEVDEEAQGGEEGADVAGDLTTTEGGSSGSGSSSDNIEEDTGKNAGVDDLGADFSELDNLLLDMNVGDTADGEQEMSMADKRKTVPEELDDILSMLETAE